MVSVITYWILIVVAYIWSGVQIMAGQPFDALVLFAVTFAFQSYRDEVLKQQRDLLFNQMDDKEE